MDYSYWKTHIENFKNQFGSKLGINCDLIIPNDYSQNVPTIVFEKIIIPSQFLDLLNGHCNWILSNQNLFQHIGNCTNERISQESFGKIDYNLTSDDFKIKYLSHNFCNQVPFDDRRQKVSAILRDLVTYFAIHHELGHARQKSFEISLEVYCGKSQDENWYNQAKEVDADIFGINWLWRLVFKNSIRLSPLKHLRKRLRY